MFFKWFQPKQNEMLLSHTVYFTRWISRITGDEYNWLEQCRSTHLDRWYLTLGHWEWQSMGFFVDCMGHIAERILPVNRWIHWFVTLAVNPCHNWYHFTWLHRPGAAPIIQVFCDETLRTNGCFFPNLNRSWVMLNAWSLACKRLLVWTAMAPLKGSTNGRNHHYCNRTYLWRCYICWLDLDCARTTASGKSQRKLNFESSRWFRQTSES